MTNPTLLAQETPWPGYTLDSIVEAMLGFRGLTNDSTTGRTVATAAEDADCKRLIKSAIDDLHAQFPSSWNIRSYTVTWVSGDHSIALPADCSSLLAVTYAGLSLRPIGRDDYYRLLRSDAEGGGVGTAETGKPAYYRVTGVTDADAGTDPGDTDYRLVLRIYPTPDDAEELVVEYVASAYEFANDEDTIPLTKACQRWVLQRAVEMWGTEAGDPALIQRAFLERQKVEQTLFTWFDSLRDRPSRVRTRPPHVYRRDRWRRR